MARTSREHVEAAVAAVHDEIMRSLVDADAERGIATPTIEDHLQMCGFIDAGSASVLRSLCRRLFSVDTDGSEVATIVTACTSVPSPDDAIRNLDRLLEQAGNPSVFVSTVAQAPPLLQMVTTVFGTSQYMADIIVRNPGHVYWLMEKSTWDSPDTTEFYAGWLNRETELFRTPESQLSAVHRTHRQALLRIGIRDLLGETSIAVTTRALSNLADAIADKVLRVVIDSNNDDLVEPDGFAVIAMGKLGGGELNYSSDIDLIYACADADDERISYYTKLSRQFTEAMSEATQEGYLYRVDLRLRPDGKAGPVVNTETALRIYYENRGRPWEFQALLKARVIAGDRALGSRILETLQKLVYSTSMSYSPLEYIAGMRDRISSNIPAHERGFNIKLMAGGIRDIEFVVQALQLMHAREHVETRSGTTLLALSTLRAAGLVENWAADNLAEAYCFFRLIEHRLQMMHQIKTHNVPESNDEIALLAKRISHGPLGTYTTAEFLETLSRYVGSVQAFADRFFGDVATDTHMMLLLLPVDDPRAVDAMREHGVSDAPRALRTLHAMAYGSFPRLLDRSVRAAFESLLPQLLQSISTMPDPDIVLTGLSQLSQAGKNESAFYRRLSDSAAACDLIVATAGLSSYLTRALSTQIDLLDEYLRPPDELGFETQFRNIPEWDRYDAKIARAGGAPLDKRCARQRAWFDRTRLREFASAYSRKLRAPQGGKGRTWVAARQLAAAFDSAFGSEKGVAIFVLGSFAVDEARMTSDLDLLVVTDGGNLPDVTSRVQHINRWFTDGRVLKLDFRLRGEGASSPLVQDLSFYKSYFAGRLSLWERIALAKCQAWWGDKGLRQQFEDELRAAVARPFTDEEVASLVGIRQQIETLAPKTFSTWDTKRSAGARYDIEYLTAIGMAQCASSDKAFFGLSTPGRLDRIQSDGFITKEERDTCRAAFELYAIIDYLMELQELTVPTSVEKHDYLSRYLDRAFAFFKFAAPDGVARLLDDTKKDVRRCFARALS